MATIEDFEKVQICCGRVVEVLPFPQARKPSYKLKIDFGATIGIKKSCAQLTVNYKPEELIGRLIAAVVNFPPRQIGPEISEVLVLGFPDRNGQAVLVMPTKDVEIGGRLF